MRQRHQSATQGATGREKEDEAEGRALRVVREASIAFILAGEGEAEHSRTADGSHGQKPS